MKTKETVRSSRPTSPAAAPKRRSRELSTKKLYKAGLEVFSKFGFEAATTKQIAKRAGMNEALIARYFNGKAGLLQAIIVDRISNSRKNSENYAPGKTLSEEIANYFHKGLEKIKKDRDFDRIIMSRALIDSKLAAELEQFLIVEPDSPLIKRLKRFQENGMISRDRNLQCVAQSIHLQMIGIFYSSAVMSHFDCEGAFEFVRQMAFDLAHGMRHSFSEKD